MNLLQKVFNSTCIITPFVIMSRLLYNNDNVRNDFYSSCKKLEWLFPDEITETESHRITFIPSRWIGTYILSSMTLLALSDYMISKGIIFEDIFDDNSDNKTIDAVVIGCFVGATVGFISMCIAAMWGNSLVVQDLNKEYIQNDIDIITDELQIDPVMLESSDININC